ncbi:hypothetical protein BJY00DRAFT_290969 [Aspergillus carlsbadensis]|nr:hypothetical protein BJY00DRAFT_290969 [Aspergillus carlsbadensis]
MAKLLSLPAELILAIVKYVQAEEQAPLPFYKWADAYEYAVKEARPKWIKDLHSFCLISRRYYTLLKPMIYRNIYVHDKAFQEHPLGQLKRTLKNDLLLENYIVSIIAPCRSSICDIQHFFRFPNIQALTILFDYLDPIKFEGNGLVGKSPVRSLSLIRCGAREEALAAILSWPEVLEVLHYDVDQGEWEGHCVDGITEGWTCAAFVRALQPQKGNLRELTLTRQWLDHEGLGNGPRIDLSGFTALTTLRIYQVFLCGEDDPLEAWRSLPSCLEELEIFYDDWDLTTFKEDEFLRGLLMQKKEHLPHLRRISIGSPEELWDTENQEYKPAGQWVPPPPLKRALELAGLELDVQLGIEILPS